MFPAPQPSTPPTTFSEPTALLEPAHAVAALARALADQLRQEKLRTKEAELRASAARTAEVKAKSELATQRAGWKQRKKKWMISKVKHQALKVKYSRLQAVCQKEHASRTTCPASPSISVANEPPPPRDKNGGSTPPSQPKRQAPPSRKPAAVKISAPPKAAAPPKKVAAAAPPKVAESLKPSFPRPEEHSIGLPPVTMMDAAPSLGRGERRKRSNPPPSSVVEAPTTHPPVFHEVVRNKAARAKMDAVTCAQCSGFFDAAGGVLGDAATRCHHDHSRHRVAAKAPRQPETPESFWQIGFDDTDREESQLKGARDPFDACLAVDKARGQRLSARTFGRKVR